MCSNTTLHSLQLPLTASVLLNMHDSHGWQNLVCLRAKDQATQLIFNEPDETNEAHTKDALSPFVGGRRDELCTRLATGE